MYTPAGRVLCIQPSGWAMLRAKKKIQGRTFAAAKPEQESRSEMSCMGGKSALIFLSGLILFMCWCISNAGFLA